MVVVTIAVTTTVARAAGVTVAMTMTIAAEFSRF
jgi:hypothetical protein